MSFFSYPWRIKLAQAVAAEPDGVRTCAPLPRKSALKWSSSHRAYSCLHFPPGFVRLFTRQPCISGLSYLARTLSPNEKHFLTYISLDAINNAAFAEANVLNLRRAVTVSLKRSIICLTELISMYCSENKNNKNKQLTAFF